MRKTGVPTRIVALLNQKGGVGKTTSTVNLGAAIAELGRRVCLIDLDPQGHLSLSLGIDGGTVGHTVYDLLVDPDAPVADAIVRARPNLDVLPSNVDLAAAETELANHPERHRLLADRFEPMLAKYDYVLLDCPPSLGLLTLNALSLAREVVVPMQAQFLAMQGLSKLLETVALISEGVNPDLKVAGTLLCMHETQSTHGREVVSELDRFFEDAAGSGVPWENAKVFRPAIRRNVKLAESPSFGQTIFDYAPWCPGALDYRTLAERFARDWERSHGVADPQFNPAPQPPPPAPPKPPPPRGAKASETPAAPAIVPASPVASARLVRAATDVRPAAKSETAAVKVDVPASPPKPAPRTPREPADAKPATVEVISPKAVKATPKAASPEPRTPEPKPSPRTPREPADAAPASPKATRTEEVAPPAKPAPRTPREPADAAPPVKVIEPKPVAPAARAEPEPPANEIRSGSLSVSPIAKPGRTAPAGS
jgi:chromosome partitioning protein